MSIAPIPAHVAVSSASRTKPATAFTPTQNGVEAVSAAPAATATSEKTPKEDKPFSFWDLVDIVNPLQHIPVVSTFYRRLSGDEIGSFARIAGGAVYGGFFGAAAGGVNAIIASETGKDVGETVVSALIGDNKVVPQPEPASQMASVETPRETPKPSIPTASSHALFDAPGSASGKGSITAKSTADTPTMPLIEVRPYPKDPEFSNIKESLPKGRDVSQLPDYEQPAVPAPVSKDKVQQAMMDALIKMQAAENDGDDTSSSSTRYN